MTTLKERIALKMMIAQIDSWIENDLESLCEPSKLQEATAYALTSGGKRVRPLLVYMVAEALDKGLSVIAACQSVEYFHTASLIADDLPCMDDDDMRRGKNSTHKEFGESTALLSSYGLIVEAFRKIEEGYQVIKQSPYKERGEEILSLALQYASKLAGFHGATLGQHYDLRGFDGSLKEVERILYLKTGTLFEVSFIFGWLFGGGDLERVKEVERLAYHFGMAFQVRDDILDFDQDEGREDTAPNIAKLIGLEGARKRFSEELSQFESLLQDLSIYSLPLQQLSERLAREV